MLNLLLDNLPLSQVKARTKVGFLQIRLIVRKLARDWRMSGGTCGDRDRSWRGKSSESCCVYFFFGIFRSCNIFNAYHAACLLFISSCRESKQSDLPVVGAAAIFRSAKVQNKDSIKHSRSLYN